MQRTTSAFVFVMTVGGVVRRFSAICAAAVLGGLFAVSTPLLAHEMIVRGTVAAIEPARIQIKTGQEKAGQQPEWFPIDRDTTIRRGTKTVTLEEAHIKVDERVVAIIDHPDKGPMKTKEIRLAAQPQARRDATATGRQEPVRRR